MPVAVWMHDDDDDVAHSKHLGRAPTCHGHVTDNFATSNCKWLQYAIRDIEETPEQRLELAYVEATRSGQARRLS